MFVCAERQIRLDAIIDRVKMLCWLRIVFSDVSEGHPLHPGRSKLEFAYLDDDSTLDIDSEVCSFPPKDELLDRACWAPAIRGFTLAQTFPVPQRRHSTGLEIVLPLLTQICGFDRAASYGGGLVIKEFSTMLVPEIYSGRGIVQLIGSHQRVGGSQRHDKCLSQRLRSCSVN